MGLLSAKGESTVLSFTGWFSVCCDAVLLFTCAPFNELMHPGYRYQIEAKDEFHKMDKGLFKRPPVSNPHVEESIYLCALGVT